MFGSSSVGLAERIGPSVSGAARGLAAIGLALLAMGPLVSPLAAADELTMDARALLDGHARSGAWMAIQVHLANGGPAISGELRLRATSSNPTTYGITVDLPTTSSKTYTLYVQPPQFGRSLPIELVSGDRVLARRDVAFLIHDQSQLVVGVAAERPQGLVGQIDLPTEPSGGVPVIVALGVADLPDRIEGWAGLDRLVWQDLDAADLTGAQLAALRGWIAGGGRLIVVGGTAGLAVLGALPDDLLPYRPTATIDTPPADLTGLLGELPDDAADVPALAGTLRAGRALATSAGRVVAAEAPYGSGSVTIIGFDPATPWIAAGTEITGLWRRVLPGRTGGPVIASDDSQIVAAAQTIPSLTLPSIDGLTLILGAYILLVGPVNYLVLRRLDRRELAWLTIPGLTVAFSIGAYAFGSIARGTDVVVTEAAIVRGGPDATEGMAQAYVGLFSPTRTTYDVEVRGGALLAAPFAQFDMFGSSTANLDILQGDPARIRDLAVGFGSVRTIRAETAAAMPRVAGDLRLEDGVLKGTVVNHSNRPLEGVAVVLGSAVAVLGDLAPNAEASVSLRVANNTFGQPLADAVVGPLFFDGTNPEAYQARSVRYSIVNQLAFDPTMGWSPGLRAESPVLLAWGRDPVLDLRIAGIEPRRSATTLYYIPLPMTIAGSVTFTSDLVRSVVIATDALFFSKDPTFINMGSGSATIGYRPVAFDGTLSTTKIRIGFSFGEPTMPAGEKPLEPLAAIPVDCTDLMNSQPDGCAPRPQDGLPEVELLDRSGAGTWVRLPHLGQGAAYALADPARYVDPQTGEVLVRFVNPTVDNNIGFAFAIAISGEIE